MAEVVKLLTCLVLVFLEEGKNVLRWKSVLHATIVKQPMDTLKVCVPSLVYIIQNNLLYVSASHLDAATYQVSVYLLDFNRVGHLIQQLCWWLHGDFDSINYRIAAAYTAADNEKTKQWH